MYCEVEAKKELPCFPAERKLGLGGEELHIVFVKIPAIGQDSLFDTATLTGR